jgi:hypothetical protein
VSVQVFLPEYLTPSPLFVVRTAAGCLAVLLCSDVEEKLLAKSASDKAPVRLVSHAAEYGPVHFYGAK